VKCEEGDVNKAWAKWESKVNGDAI